MPHVAALAVASWVAGTAITTASAAVAAGVGVAAAYGLTYVATAAVLGAGMTALTTPKVGGQTKPPTEWQGDPNAPLPFILGRRGVGGYQVRKKEFGTDNRYMMVVTVVSAAGPVNAWESTKIDGVAYSQTGDRLNHPKYNNWAWRQVRLGAQPETAFTLPPGMEGAVALPGWGANHKLSGKAAEMLILRQNGEFSYWPTEPRTVRVIQGLKVWDPRLDSTYPGGSGPCRRDNPATHIYSLNPIIHGLNNALGYWENGKLIGGIGASLRAVDVAAFVAAANISDLNAWKVSAEITTADDKYQALQALLQAGGAIYTRINGRISCISRGAPRVSIATISAADTAGPIQIRTSAPREGRVNTITPRCVQEDQDWEMTALEPVTSSAFVDEDGGERPAGIDYPYVPDANQAAQLAGLDLVKVREPFVGSVPLKPYMRHLKPGDAFTITEPDFLLDGVQCVVERRSFDVETSIATVEFSSDTPGAIEWALTREGTPPPTQTLTPPPTDFPAPVVGEWVAVAGTEQPSIVITGAAANTFTENILFEYRKVGSADWIVWTETTGTIQRVEITGLDALTDYQVRVIYRSIWGPRSDPTVLPTVTTGSSSATVSEDTEAVGGVPSDVINDQIGTGATNDELAALALVQAAAGRMKVQKLATELGFDAGERVGTKVRRETIERLTAQEAMVLDIEGLAAGLETADGLISGLSLDVTEILVSLDGKVSITDFNLLEGRMDTAEGEIVATALDITTIETDLAGKASISSVDTLDGRLDTAEGSITAQAADITALELDVAGKASITAADALDARLDTAEGTIAGHTLDITAIELDVAGKASISTTNTLDARLDTAEGTITGHTADISAIEIDVAGKVSVTDFSVLEAEVGDHTATLLTYGSVLVDLEGRTEAYMKFYAAAGAEPAYAELLADIDGSMLRLVAKELSFANASGGTIVEVLKLVGGLAYFGSPITSDAGGERLTVGPGFGVSSDLVLWFGADSVALGSMTPANAAVALDTAGNLHMPNQVTTDSVATGALLKTSYHKTGPGEISLANAQASAGSDRTLVKTLTFTVLRGEVLMVDIVFQYELNNGNAVRYWAKLDGETAATWIRLTSPARGEMSNPDDYGEVQFNTNDHGSTTMMFRLENVTPGTHTMTLYANEGGGTANKIVEPTFRIAEHLRGA